MKYDKPALSFDQQIDQLESRGMAFGDRALAARFLREINYYRLRPAWQPAAEPDQSPNPLA